MNCRNCGGRVTHRQWCIDEAWAKAAPLVKRILAQRPKTEKPKRRGGI